MKQTSLFQDTKRLLGFTGLIAVIAMWCGPMIAFACSGDGAGDLIDHNRFIVQICAALSIVLFVSALIFYFLRRKKGLWVLIVSFILVVFQPAWMYGGGGGDCGISMVSHAKFSVVLLGIGVAHQLRSWLISRH
jgi:hypothetical protein